MGSNGHNPEPRRFRVPFKAGQYLVIVNDWDGEVDGPHKQEHSGYKYAIAGRRSIHVFDDVDLAMRFAEEAIEGMVDEQGEDI